MSFGTSGVAEKVQKEPENRAQLFTLFALGNLLLVRRRMMA